MSFVWFLSFIVVFMRHFRLTLFNFKRFHFFGINGENAEGFPANLANFGV